MIDNGRNMSCQEFDACMAELVAAGEDMFAHPHVRRCKLHRAFLEELEVIAQAARQLFPDLDPPEAVWNGIEAEIASQPGPVFSDPLPGYRVVFSMRFIEQGSPPPPERSSSKEESPNIRRRPCISRREGRG